MIPNSKLSFTPMMPEFWEDTNIYSLDPVNTHMRPGIEPFVDHGMRITSQRGPAIGFTTEGHVAFICRPIS